VVTDVVDDMVDVSVADVSVVVEFAVYSGPQFPYCRKHRLYSLPGSMLLESTSSFQDAPSSSREASAVSIPSASSQDVARYAWEAAVQVPQSSKIGCDGP
jgi:hypothetical protein